MSGTPRLKPPSLCLRCQDLAEGREAAKEDGRQPRPWLLTPSSGPHDLVTGVKERTSPPSEAKKTVAAKPRATPAVLAGSGLLGSRGLCCPWVAWSSSLGSCAVFVVGSYHATLGYLSERGPGTGVAEHRDSQSSLASQMHLLLLPRGDRSSRLLSY